MRVQFVGSGDALGSGGRYQTCICLSGGRQMTLADCGATSLTALKAQRLNPGTINAVAVTHLHGDHFGGPPFFILDGQFTGRKAPPLVGRAARYHRPAGTGNGNPVPGSSRGRDDSPCR